MPAERRTRALRAVGRGAVALAAAIVCTAAVAAAVIVPWPEHRAEPESVVVAPVESRQQRVCPGPLLELAEDAGAATTASSFGSADLVTATFPADIEVDEVPIDAPDDDEADVDRGPVAIEVEPTAAEIGMLAGAQSQRAQQETLAGLAVAACREPAAESWLVGGSTALGRTTLVLLANPAEVAATVDLRIYGEAGPIDAPAGLGLVVPAGTQRVVSLAGLAPDLAAPVVRVTSSGGRIAATLQQSAIDGLVPAGVELIAPAASPADQVRIPGVVVAEAGGVASDEDHLDGDAFPALRLLAPGADDVDATVSVVPEHGAARTSIEVTLLAGEAIDVPLGELSPGAYSIDLVADGPVVAAARSSIAPGEEEDEAGDFAWFPATTALIGDLAVAVPDVAAPVLHLAAPGREDVHAVVATRGAEREITVPGGGAIAVTVSPGDELVLRGVDGLFASVSSIGARMLSSFAIEPPGPVDAPIRVYPR
ncbi:DUF5719 family protein [Agromyces larvae]|uniref:DUF5719 family protein n=1 Tax=Agromyces larvae TaxID=2929802 RepID=A0ABY4BZB3_9MICO|nr:DUF5719 family protein [Agromyces larvae]UOE44520.1 DUF5719 family protein [Agromyces larvae]